MVVRVAVRWKQLVPIWESFGIDARAEHFADAEVVIVLGLQQEDRRARRGDRRR
jgi:hypothetical protein